MKAIMVNKPGNVDVLEVVELPIPIVREGWSLIKIKSFGINRSEIFTRQGHSPNVEFPRVLGIECVGVIADTTDEERLPIGQKVLSTMGEMGRAFDGSYAEYVLVPNEQIFPIKTNLSWIDFAAVPETYFTAYGSMLQLQIQPEDKVLVHGAASGVGIAFTKLVKATFPNLKIYGSVRNFNKESQLLALGYDGIIKEEEGLLKTNDMFNKVLELVGPSVIKNTISRLNKYGIICCTGLLGGQWFLEDFDPTFDLRKNIYLTTFYSGNVSEKAWQELICYIEQHNVDVKAKKVFEIDEIRLAHEYLESSEAIGKVVIRNED